MKNCSDYTWEYIANFLTDFFETSDTTTDFFNLPIINETVKEKNNIFLDKKELKKHIDFVNNYNNNNKINYMVNGRTRCFFCR